MNRSSSTIAVLGLLLIGLAVCLKQTLDFYDYFGASMASMFLTAEALFAAIVLASVVLLLRSKFSDRENPPGQSVSKLLRSCAVYSQAFGLRSFAADDGDCRLRDAEFLRDQSDQFRVSGSINGR